MALNMRWKASTLIENLVAMTLISIGVSSFYRVYGQLQTSLLKTEVSSRALHEITYHFCQLRAIEHYKDTLIYTNDFTLSFTHESIKSNLIKQKAVAYTESGDTLIIRTIYHVQNKQNGQ